MKESVREIEERIENINKEIERKGFVSNKDEHKLATLAKAIEILSEPDKEYQITMTSQEVSVLKSIVSHVGGVPNGPRGHIDTLRQKLSAIDSVYVPVYYHDKNNSIYIYPKDSSEMYD